MPARGLAGFGPEWPIPAPTILYIRVLDGMTAFGGAKRRFDSARTCTRP